MEALLTLDLWRLFYRYVGSRIISTVSSASVGLHELWFEQIISTQTFRWGSAARWTGSKIIQTAEKAKRLERIRLVGFMSWKGVHLAAFQKLPFLRSIKIMNCVVSQEQLQEFSHLVNLRAIQINLGYRADHFYSDLSFLLPMTSLRSLSLSGNRSLNEEAFVCLSALTTLQKLELSSLPLVKVCAPSLLAIQFLREMRYHS